LRYRRRGEEFIFDYGEAFPENPKIFTFFIRTDLIESEDVQIPLFFYNGKKWIPIAGNDAFSVEAETSRDYNIKPITRDQIGKNALVFPEPSTSQNPPSAQQIEDAIDKVKDFLGSSPLSQSLVDRLRTGPVSTGESNSVDDFENDGKFVPRKPETTVAEDEDISSSKTYPDFDKDGNFIPRPTDPDYALDHLRVEGKGSTPYDDCIFSDD